jgi:transcriptional regulator of stress and heat shock response
MMPTIAELIAAYLKQMLAASNEGIIEVRRSDLAITFSCAPSQINYVLGTRFTPEHGFLIETRRGGGGYIRITRIAMEHEYILEFMQECNSYSSLQNFVARLYDEGFFTKREMNLVKEFINAGVTSPQVLRAIAVLLKEE